MQRLFQPPQGTPGLALPPVKLRRTDSTPVRESFMGYYPTYNHTDNRFSIYNNGQQPRPGQFNIIPPPGLHA